MASLKDKQKKIFSSIEKIMEGSDTLPWAKGWTTSSPRNIVTGNTYRGYNLIATMGHSHWSTTNGWNSLGAKVKKGSKGTLIFRYVPTRGQKKEDKDEKPARGGGWKMLKIWYVFNSDQVEGWSPPEKDEFLSIKDAEKVVANMPQRPAIKHGGDRACYSPLRDEVKMPTKEQFDCPDEYYATLAHELTHSTGHKERLGRPQLADLESEHAYSREELVAELGSCFLGGSMGIEPNLNNSAAYIQYWRSQITSDPKILMDAASDAARAQDFILGTSWKEKESDERSKS